MPSRPVTLQNLAKSIVSENFGVSIVFIFLRRGPKVPNLSRGVDDGQAHPPPFIKQLPYRWGVFG